MRKINKDGDVLIKRFESLELKPYTCQAGILTVGWGHTGKDIIRNKIYTKDECQKLFDKDISVFENAVSRLVKCKLNDNQFSALVSFCYNVGIGALERSILLERLNKNENPNIVIRKKFMEYTSYTVRDKKGNPILDENGKKIKKQSLGLLNRRMAEIALFTNPIKEFLNG
jgi:lysozyme